MSSLFDLMGLPILESPLVPPARSEIVRREWATRLPGGGWHVDHSIRKLGSVYEVKTTPRQALFIQGLGVVMHPDDAKAVRISSVV